MMQGAAFLNVDTAKVLLLGLVAFALDTIGGLLFGKLVCALSGRRINPLVGAAATSAFPMSGRLAQKVALEEDNQNFILMHAIGANTAGQVASVIAAGGADGADLSLDSAIGLAGRTRLRNCACT